VIGRAPQQSKVEWLRELLHTAKRLRFAAADTNDDVYISLFVKAAMALEERAAGFASESSPVNEPLLLSDLEPI
jgi:hypothetical protein